MLANPIDIELYNSIDIELTDIVKLCSDATTSISYSCTTQYTIWRRELLIKILKRVATPWQFEVYGSVVLNSTTDENNRKLSLIHVPCMKYPSYSCLSSKWEGVKLEGNEHDEKEIRKLL